jgi:putative DNA-invertase from lambdoid prophage Rac
VPRTFAYIRVSTAGQTTDNQLREIAAAGFEVEPRRVAAETVSGDGPRANLGILLAKSR